jgi:putative ABC transport system permease protein
MATLRPFQRGFGENLRFALLAVRAHKLRASLTVLGIVVGVATVIAMVSIVTGFNNNMVRSFQSFGATVVTFQKFEVRFGGGGLPEGEQRRRELTVEDAAALKASIPEIRAVAPTRYLWNNTQFNARNRDFEVQFPRVWGATPDYPIANNRSVSVGRFLTDSDMSHAEAVVVIGDEIREKLFPREDPLDKTIKLGADHYRVVGVLDKMGKMFNNNNDNFIVMPITTFDQHFPWIKNGSVADGDALRISAVPFKPEQVPLIIEKGESLLRTRRRVPFNKPNDFAIVTPDKLIESFQGITNGVTLAMVFVAFVSLVIGGVGVMNIMLVSVTERTREIGVRKAVGAHRRDIVMQFLTEATTLSLLGGAIGILVGYAVPALVKKFFEALPAETPVWSVLVGLVVSMSVGVFFGLYPAVKASRLDPIEALRYE